MEEKRITEEKKISYYQKNKHKYKKGGKYYYYKSVEETRPKIPMTVVRRDFLISFD
tara:strand:- start:796 stop:963 length:168 start_codon:yes stop_codon:yes gene_type:complete